MQWSLSEIEELSPILDRIKTELEPLDGKNIVVLCSAAGEVPFWLAKSMTQGHILGLELNRELLKAAQLSAEKRHLSHLTEFRETEKTRLLLQDTTFDALVSEFIIFPGPTPTEIGQSEMARVLKPGGKMIITDVLLTQPVSPEVRQELSHLGLDYLCEATAEDFRSWMQEAGLVDIDVKDMTPIVKRVWEQRRTQAPVLGHRMGYSFLFDDSPAKLGDGLYYMYVQGTKPMPQ
jgi:SAM-dependent methyltransferase